MPTNIEIKAVLRDREFALKVAKALSKTEGVVLKQEDTFYNVPNGRLKGANNPFHWYQKDGCSYWNFSFDGVLEAAMDMEHGPYTQLRVLEGKKIAEVISYSRPDVKGPKCSEFSIASIECPEDMNRVLTESLGVLGQVKKTRLLFLVDQTRVHIDCVHGLGDYLELEVMLKDSHTPSEGQDIARDLMKQLHVDQDCLVAGAYLDLLLAQN